MSERADCEQILDRAGALGANRQVLYDPLWCVQCLAGYETVTEFRFQSGVSSACHGSVYLGALPPHNFFVVYGVSLRSLPPWPVAVLSRGFPRAQFLFFVGNKSYLDLPLDALLWNGSARYAGHALERPLLLEPGVNFRGSLRWEGTAPADVVTRGREGDLKLLLMLEGYRSRAFQ